MEQGLPGSIRPFPDIHYCQTKLSALCGSRHLLLHIVRAYNANKPTNAKKYVVSALHNLLISSDALTDAIRMEK